MMYIDASVVICTFTLDRWDDLKASVGSVLQQTYQPREILIVVDYNDELQRRVEAEFTADIVKVASNKYERGIAGNRSTGSELAISTIIAFLDDDCRANPDWLEKLLKGYDNSHVLGVGGMIAPLWHVARPIWFPAEFDWVLGCTFDGMPVRNDGTIRNLISANMSVRADVVRAAGGFAGRLGRRNVKDTVLGVVADSCEDTEFCIRASACHPGGVWKYCSDARIEQVVTAQRANWSYFVFRCEMEGRSKAVLTMLAGSRSGLHSERRYLWSLVWAFLRDVATGNFRRAVVIYLGLLITTKAFVQARIAAQRALRKTLASVPD